MSFTFMFLEEIHSKACGSLFHLRRIPEGDPPQQNTDPALTIPEMPGIYELEEHRGRFNREI
jgi:hypothetical protein